MKENDHLHYKGYTGTVKYSEEDKIFHGKIVGIKSLISYEGDSVKTITQDFMNAIDEYLEHCAAWGDEPEKPYKGSFNIRIESDLHQQAALTASSRGMTLNSFVEEAIRKYVAT